jgi:NAD(P)-dependent dehydrogenase (short-subunit alcohol dehydrogenase family)
MILKNKNILITGAGKGIGFETVKMLINEGAFVYALIKSKQDYKKFRKVNKKNIKFFFGRVENLSTIKKIFKDSIKRKKIINCLINNAGVRLRKSFSLIKKKELLDVFNTNFFSIFFISQIFSKILIKNKISGSIINISSIVGQSGFQELSVYGSTKGALISLTKSLANELASKNINVNSISPGFTKTSYYKNFKKNKKKLYKWTLSRIPMNRWGESREISHLICFLASDKSSYINGENFNIDGGWTSS